MCVCVLYVLKILLGKAMAMATLLKTIFSLTSKEEYSD